MKTNNVLCALGILLFQPYCSSLARAQGQPGSDRVRVRVTVQAKEERKDLKGTHTTQITVHRVLAIQLTGVAKARESRVARWRVFGKDLVTNKVMRAAAGEFPLALDSSGAQSVTTEQ